MAEPMRQPKICPDCLKLMEEHRKTDQRLNQFVAWCPHHETMAIVRIENGEIVSWTMERPIRNTEELAQRTAEIARTAEVMSVAYTEDRTLN